MEPIGAQDLKSVKSYLLSLLIFVFCVCIMPFCSAQVVTVCGALVYCLLWNESGSIPQSQPLADTCILSAGLRCLAMRGRPVGALIVRKAARDGSDIALS